MYIKINNDDEWKGGGNKWTNGNGERCCCVYLFSIDSRHNKIKLKNQFQLVLNLLYRITDNKMTQKTVESRKPLFIKHSLFLKYNALAMFNRAQKKQV
jgi:hypothetical protein